MGRISYPTVSQSQPVYYTTPVSPSTESDSSSEPEKTDEEIQAEGRTEGLLRRSRGRLGTILTGFTGFLNSISQGEEKRRKTLLGE